MRERRITLVAREFFFTLPVSHISSHYTKPITTVLYTQCPVGNLICHEIRYCLSEEIWYLYKSSHQTWLLRTLKKDFYIFLFKNRLNTQFNQPAASTRENWRQGSTLFFFPSTSPVTHASKLLILWYFSSSNSFLFIATHTRLMFSSNWVLCVAAVRPVANALIWHQSNSISFTLGCWYTELSPTTLYIWRVDWAQQPRIKGLTMTMARNISFTAQLTVQYTHLLTWKLIYQTAMRSLKVLQKRSGNKETTSWRSSAPSLTQHQLIEEIRDIMAISFSILRYFWPKKKGSHSLCNVASEKIPDLTATFSSISKENIIVYNP